MKKLYSNEEIYNYHKLYIEKQLSISEFCRKLHLSRNAIYKAFIKNNLKIIPQSVTRRKFLIDENYFDYINTEDKAYFLGLLYADGNNYTKKNTAYNCV